jgi:branched-chain amino acid transport system ATP-binding protein
MVALIETLAGETTVVLVEHDVDLVMGLVDSLTVVHDGEIIAEGSPDEIRENRTVENVYLGRQE